MGKFLVNECNLGNNTKKNQKERKTDAFWKQSLEIVLYVNFAWACIKICNADVQHLLLDPLHVCMSGNLYI